jgi:hypothetical protein
MIETIKPALSLVDAELVIEALDDLGLASRDIEKVTRCGEIVDRISASAHRKGWRLETDA